VPGAVSIFQGVVVLPGDMQSRGRASGLGFRRIGICWFAASSLAGSQVFATLRPSAFTGLSANAFERNTMRNSNPP